jgi:uncharacterized membrane protein
MPFPDSERHNENGFRLRGTGISRLEVFSDVIFGLALTLLVVSLQVPKNFGELRVSVRGFLPFAICFGLFSLLWHAHYQFFRRYALHDRTTLALNSVLLFVVLFYVYPLKFLFGALAGEWSGNFSGQFRSQSEIPELVLLYGVGFAAAFLLVAALHVNAWRQREKLELTGTERLITMASVVDAVGVAGVGLFSCALGLLLPSSHAADAGFAYILVAPWKMLTGIYFGRKVRLLEKLLDAPG